MNREGESGIFWFELNLVHRSSTGLRKRSTWILSFSSKLYASGNHTGVVLWIQLQYHDSCTLTLGFCPTWINVLIWQMQFAAIVHSHSQHSLTHFWIWWHRENSMSFMSLMQKLGVKKWIGNWLTAVLESADRLVLSWLLYYKFWGVLGLGMISKQRTQTLLTVEKSLSNALTGFFFMYTGWSPREWDRWCCAKVGVSWVIFIWLPPLLLHF